MPITIRIATEGDLRAVVTLLGELHDPPDSLPDPHVWRSMLAQEGRTILLAAVDGEPAGTADMWVSPNLTYGARPRASVENVAVDAAHRRHGVGRALMREVERRALDAGCYKVQLMSAIRREGAHRFYEDLGYERVAVGFRKYFGGVRR